MVQKGRHLAKRKWGRTKEVDGYETPIVSSFIPAEQLHKWKDLTWHCVDVLSETTQYWKALPSTC